jgi:hypothetical protein
MQDQSQIASALHLLPQDVTTAQGVSNDQLRAIELKAYSNVANTAVKNRDMTRSDADAWLKDLDTMLSCLTHSSLSLPCLTQFASQRCNRTIHLRQRLLQHTTMPHG